MEPGRLTAFDHIYQVLLVWKSLGVEETLSELGEGNIVDVATGELLVLESETGTVYLVSKDLICATVVLICLHRLTS